MRMRLYSGMIFFIFTRQALCQCPVAVRDAGTRGDGAKLVIEYSNLGARPIKSVQLELRTVDNAGEASSAPIHLGATGQLPPRRSRSAVFNAETERPLFPQKANGIQPLEVEVTGVTFLDRSTWTPPKGTVCKAVFPQK